MLRSVGRPTCKLNNVVVVRRPYIIALVVKVGNIG